MDLKRVALRSPYVVLGLIVVGVAALLAYRGAGSHYLFADELVSINMGRAIAAGQTSALTIETGRGVERVIAAMAALASGVTGTPTSQIRLLHISMAFIQGLIALPVYATARQLGIGRWQSLAPALVACTGAFAVYGIFVLNTSIGVLCFSLLLWAAARSFRKPGVGSDLLVVAAIAATAVTRIGYAPLAGALVPAFVAVIWFSRPCGERFRTFLTAFPGRLARNHPILTPLAVLLLVLAAALGPASLVGGNNYGGSLLGQVLSVHELTVNSEYMLTRLAIGVAIVPFMLAVPLILRNLFRPPEPSAGGFSWLVIGVLVVFSYVYYLRMNEDRYIAVLVPVVALAAALAVFRKPALPAWAVMLSALAVARLVVTNFRWPVSEPFDFFIAPTLKFFQRAVVERLSIYLPIDTGWLPTVILIVAATAAVAVAIVVRSDRLRSPGGRALCGAVFAAVAVFQIAAMDYPARKFVDALGMASVSDQRISFIDQAAKGLVARPLAAGGSVDPDLSAQLPQLLTFNTSLGRPWPVVVASPAQKAAAGAPLAEAVIDASSGVVTATSDPPGVILFKTGFAPIGFSGRYFPPPAEFPYARLERLDRPLRTSWLVLGADQQGYSFAGKAILLRVFATGRGGACVRGILLVDPRIGPALKYQLSGPGLRRAGSLAAGAPLSFELPRSNKAVRTYRLTSQSARVEGVGRIGAGVFDLESVPCQLHSN